VRRIVKESGLRPLEAGSKAAELVGALYAPLVQQLDPARLAECARGLAVGKAYAERVLRRYRPALWAESGPQLLDRLVQDYATHNFVLDREELAEVGLPTRAPDDTEAALLNQFALVLIAFGTDDDLIALVTVDDGTPTPAAAGSSQGRGHTPRKTHRARAGRTVYTGRSLCELKAWSMPEMAEGAARTLTRSGEAGPALLRPDATGSPR
jgi:hypothetical protein